MRTTLNIDDPVLAALKEHARRQGRTTSETASELLRRALLEATRGVQAGLARHGFRPFPATPSEDRTTSCQVNRLRDELGI